MKSFINTIITIIITILIIILGLSIGIKEVCVNTLSNVIVKKEFASNINDAIIDMYKITDVEIMQDIENSIQNSKTVDDITAKYFDELIITINNDSTVTIPDTKEDLRKLIAENEDILKKHNIEITEDQKEEMINKVITSGQLEQTYETIVDNLKGNLTTKQSQVLNVYNSLTATHLRISLIIAIALLTIIIAVIKKSPYKWTLNLGIATIISGGITAIVLPLIIKTLSLSITNDVIGRSTQININALSIYGYICLGLGIILIILYNIINHKKTT